MVGQRSLFTKGTKGIMMQLKLQVKKFLQVLQDKNLQERLYGQGGGGMGSGDPTGILSSTAISQKCLKDKEI